MKRLLAFILVFIIIITSITMISCKAKKSDDESEFESANTPVAPDVVWTTIGSTDEFGDTDSTPTAIRCEINGTFSNTATSSSTLGGYIFINRENWITIRLLEYGSHKATFLSDDANSIVLKTKINGKVNDNYTVTASAPNSDLYIFDSDHICSQLSKGNNVQCVIYIGSSTYNFEIKSGNYNEAIAKISK